MSATKGDMDWIAAKLGAIERTMQAANDERLDSFRALLSSIETGLAELLENVEKGGGAAAIEQVTKGLADAMSKGLGTMQPIVNYTAPAIDLQPQFNVPPAEVPTLPPITLAPESVRALAEAMSRLTINAEFEANVPAQAAPIIKLPRIAKWEIRIPGQYGAADKTMTITPTYKD